MMNLISRFHSFIRNRSKARRAVPRGIRHMPVHICRALSTAFGSLLAEINQKESEKYENQKEIVRNYACVYVGV